MLETQMILDLLLFHLKISIYIILVRVEEKLNNYNKKFAVKSRKNCRGFSYIEILIAAIVLSILTVSALRLFANLGESSRALTDKDAAMKVALELVVEMKNLGIFHFL